MFNLHEIPKKETFYATYDSRRYACRSSSGSGFEKTEYGGRPYVENWFHYNFICSAALFQIMSSIG